jgi:hypothetical protein
MSKSIVAALACVAGLLSGPDATAAPITYAFTGTTFGYPGMAGQTVTGTYTYDPALYTGSFTDGATINQAYRDGAPVGSAFGTLSLSGGLRSDVGGAGTQWGVSYQTIVKKGFAAGGTAAVDSFEVYAASIDAAGNTHAFELLTQSPSASSDLIVPGTPGDDLSVTQPVSFMTPGSWNVGYFAVISPDSTSFIASDFLITSISAVPETPVFPMMMLGLALLSFRARGKSRD